MQGELREPKGLYSVYYQFASFWNCSSRGPVYLVFLYMRFPFLSSHVFLNPLQSHFALNNSTNLFGKW